MAIENQSKHERLAEDLPWGNLSRPLLEGRKRQR